MRYKIMYNDEVVAEALYCDLAEAAVRNSPVEVTLVDEWSGKTLSVSTDAVQRVQATDENPYALPLSYIRFELMREGRKIPLIKLVRELTGLGLGEAKGIIDRIDAEENLRARRVDPTENY